MSAIELKNISKLFCDKNICVAANLSFEVEHGEICTILGESGSGKSTILRMIAGFEKPDSGEIFIDDEMVFGQNTNKTARERNIGVVFQNFALFPNLNVLDNVLFGLDGKKNKRELAAFYIDLCGLNSHINHYPNELSGGQQQRVALARALAPEPKLILLDEPFSALDASLRKNIRSEIREILKSANSTAILVTHDKHDAFELSNKIAILEGGEFVQIGSPKELYRSPKNEFIARSLGEINKIPRKLIDGEEGELFLRPEQIKISKSSGKIECVVKNTLFKGGYNEVEAISGGFSLHIHTDMELESGERIFIDL